jgi:PEP-CTERM motif
MRKHFLFAGILLAAALVFALPSKADTVDFSLSGPALPSATFTLPQTFTPSSMFGSIAYVLNSSGNITNSAITVGGFSGSYTYGTIDLGNSGLGAWSFGSAGSPGHPGPELGIFVAGLFTVNPDGTISLNAGTWTLFNNVGSPLTLTTTVIPGPVGTPEPTTLALMGMGGLLLAGLRRRKAA